MQLVLHACDSRALQVQLAPWSLHGALRTAQDVWNAWRGCANLEVSTILEDLKGPDLSDQAGGAGVADGLGSGLEGLKSLTFQVEVEAPILRLQAWEDGASLELHLGRFFSRSLKKEKLKIDSGASLMALVDQYAEGVEPADFALLCELRDTRLTLLEPGQQDRKPYEPSTIVFGAFLDEGIQIHTEATEIRLHVDPGLLRLLGQIRGGLDFAVAPLSQDFVGVSSSSSSSRQDKFKGRSPPSPFQKLPVCFALTTSSFDLNWDPAGRACHAESVKGHVAGFRFGLRGNASGLEIHGSAQDVRLDCGGRRFLSSLGHLDVAANYLQQSIHLQISAPPLELRWAAISVRIGRAALEAIQKELQSGQSEAFRRCGGADVSVSRALWDHFVAERTEELRGAWDQAITNLSNDEPSAARLSVALCLQSQGLRAVLLRPGSSIVEDTEELRATMLGFDCQLKRHEGLQFSSTLSSLEVWLGSRLLLAPRQADRPLLEVNIDRLCKSRFVMNVTWAQIALVYRQRDFERIASLCQKEISVSGSLTETSSGPPKAAGHDKAAKEAEKPVSEKQSSSTSWRYSFNIDAPLLFLPASTGKNCDVGMLPPDDLRGGLSIEDSSQAERTFLPLPEEGFGVLDLGNCLVENDTENSSDTTITVRLRRLQIFSVASRDRDKQQLWSQVLMPVTAVVEVRSSTDCLDIQVHAPLTLPDKPESQSLRCHDPLRVLQAGESSESSCGLQSTINLTRAQATQLFDVLYLNLTYASADEVA